jgi:putative transposase
MSANVKELPRRRHLRLRDYDYAQPGAYFITLCSHRRACLFGVIHSGMMQPNSWGRVVGETWHEQMDVPGNIRTDEWVLMPNHFHAIVLIEAEESGSRAAPTRSLPRIINAFKTVSAKRINQIRGGIGLPVWQRSYYEHIVRTEGELERIRDYIRENPAKWDEDLENPEKKALANHDDKSKR